MAVRIIEKQKTENVADNEENLFIKFIKNRTQSSEVDLKDEAVKNSSIRIETMDSLFKILIATYGKGFADQFDNDMAKDLWLGALLVFTLDEIADGLALTLDDPYPTPPNLKRFILSCKEAKKKKMTQKNETYETDDSNSILRRLPKYKKTK